MKLLRDPLIKEYTFFQALCGFLVSQLIMYIAFTYGIVWMTILFQIFISFIFVTGIIPIIPDKNTVKHRFRLEQKYLYVPVNTLVYGLWSGNNIFFLMYLVGAISLILKGDVVVKRADEEYTKKVEQLMSMKGKNISGSLSK